MRPSLRPLVALAALAGVSAPLAAQITPGSTLTFTGTADATDIGLGGVMLDFTKQVFAVPAGTTGTFAVLNTRGPDGAQGKISDVRVGNGPQVIPNFLQFGGYKFTLLGLPSGQYGQDACYTENFAVGQTCTPYQSVQGDPTVNVGLSPFNVANVSANPDGSINSTAAFDVYGFVTAPGGATSTFSGTIASSFVGAPYQVVLYTLEQQGLQGLTFTGTFTTGRVLGGGRGSALFAEAGLLDAGVVDVTATPEPTTVGLVAVGLLGVAGWRRRAARR